MQKTWRVTSSPHIRARRTTRGIMLDVVLALLPAGVAGVWFFGARAAALIAISVASAVLWEALIQKIMKKPITVGDLSAVVTGLLLAYNLPATVPFWLPIVGTGVAIVLVKQIFGGLGQNFMNPALASRAILLSSWTGLMSSHAFLTDAVSAATPLVAESADQFAVLDMFLGNIPGCIGEVSKLALLIGGAYLLVRRVISWHIPVTMLATVFAAFWLYSGEAYGAVESGLYQLLSGGLILGAFFMATDYATSPVTQIGKLIMGVGCGLLIFVIRAFNTNFPEGFSYAILTMNLVTPLIDRFTKPRVYGEVRVRA